MEVVVPEEKKKIFRARKTMKMSDRLQLESLHSTLLTTPGSSNPSPPPLMNGTHKEDGQKTSDKEQNNISDSNSPAATSPASPTSLSSPTPFLSLNLSPSPASSESPKPQDEASCPNSPLSPDFPDAKKTEDKEKKSSSSSYPDDSVTPVPSECKDQQKNGISTGEKEEKKQTNTEDPAGDSGTDSSKEAVSTSPAPPSTSKCIKPMETETNTTNADDSEASTSTRKDENSSCSSVTTSTSTLPPGSGKDINETIEIKEDDVEEEEDEKPNKNTESKSEEKMEVDKIQSEFRKETKEDEKCTKPARPSSTPPSNPDKEGKSSTSGLKRTLSEGDEKDDVTVKMEGKRPKMEHEELEAHLKLKITAKAGSQHKLEKIVQQLVNEQLQILELAIFDKHFKELKDRVDKVECATKHQTAINTLQSKISRLVKKFGEANQASENKKKQEALAAATTAAAAAAAAAAVKPPTATNTPQAQRVLRGQTVAPKPEVARGVVAPPLGKTPTWSVEKEEEEEEEEEEDDEEEEEVEEMGEEKETDVSRNIAMARKLAEYSEGRCRADVKLRPISSRLESVLYHNCKRGSDTPRPDRYASYLFRYLVPYEIYCEWVAKVNYVGLLGKEALPMNLRRTIRMYIERRFPLLPIEKWREIRDVINEILRVKRKSEFFREYDERIVLSF